MTFQIYAPTNIEFGVCRGPLSSNDAVIVPVDGGVQQLLHEMVLQTRAELGLASEDVELETYEPAQEYGAERRVRLSLQSTLCKHLLAAYEWENLPVNAQALSDPKDVTAYFCVLHDQNGNKLVAMRRAAQFKGVLKARLIRLLDDSLRAVGDSVFKLDSEFDFLITDVDVFVLRMPGFEQLAEIDVEIRGAARENTLSLANVLPQIDFDSLAAFVATHKRAGRIVASLILRQDLGSTSIPKLKAECKKNGIDVRSVNGKLSAAPGSEFALLQLLDRRRYSLSLVPDRVEQYEAYNRKGVGVRNQDENGKVDPSRRRGAAS